VDIEQKYNTLSSWKIMTDTQFKVGDLVYDNKGSYRKEFGIIYDFDAGEDRWDKPIVKIYWQISQDTVNYYLQTLMDRVVSVDQYWNHYPSETK